VIRPAAERFTVRRAGTSFAGDEQPIARASHGDAVEDVFARRSMTADTEIEPRGDASGFRRDDGDAIAVQMLAQISPSPAGSFRLSIGLRVADHAPGPAERRIEKRSRRRRS
jgi:hypothetical protein